MASAVGHSAFSSAAAAAAATAPSSSSSVQQQELVPPINFSLVCPGVYRSGYPTKKNYPFLRALGLCSILYLCPEEYAESNLKFCEENGISVLRFPTEGNKEPFTDISETLVHNILTALCDTRTHPIMIHCNKGKHRTGTVCGCLRLTQGWSLVSIFREYTAFAGNKSRVSDQTFIELYFPIVKLAPAHTARWVTVTPRAKFVFSDRELAEEAAAQLGGSLIGSMAKPEKPKKIKQQTTTTTGGGATDATPTTATAATVASSTIAPHPSSPSSLKPAPAPVPVPVVVVSPATTATATTNATTTTVAAAAAPSSSLSSASTVRPPTVATASTTSTTATATAPPPRQSSTGAFPATHPAHGKSSSGSGGGATTTATTASGGGGGGKDSIAGRSSSGNKLKQQQQHQQSSAAGSSEASPLLAGRGQSGEVKTEKKK